MLVDILSVSLLFSGTDPCPCVSNCGGKSNGDYQSCQGCNVYASCWDGVLTDGRPCPWPGMWDDSSKGCVPSPTTCPCPAPTPQPTGKPTPNPTRKPIATPNPTKKPTPNPTKKPTPNPTRKPTLNPTGKPTLNPTGKPSLKPTPNPTGKPTLNPTKNPTITPTTHPTSDPLSQPTIAQTMPSNNPTPRPINPVNVVIVAGPTERPTNLGEGEVIQSTNAGFRDKDDNGGNANLSLLQILQMLPTSAIVILIAIVLCLLLCILYWIRKYYKEKQAVQETVNIIQEPGEPGHHKDGIMPNQPQVSDDVTTAKECGEHVTDDDSSDDSSDDRNDDSNAIPDLPVETKHDTDDDDDDDGMWEPVVRKATTTSDTGIHVVKKGRESVMKRKELLKLSTGKLAKMCRQQHVSSKGRKADIVNRLVKATKGANV